MMRKVMPGRTFILEHPRPPDRVLNTENFILEPFEDKVLARLSWWLRP